MAKKMCKNCRFGQCLYINFSLVMRKIYKCLCSESGKIFDENQSCEKWKRKIPADYDVSVQRIDCVVEDIKYLIENLEI